MDREILFRGKRLDNGEWVYGQYAYLLNFRTEDGEPIKHIILDGTPFGHAIDPSTLGQYTGLTDKNEKKIFEGDVLAIDASKKFVVCYGEGKFYMDGTAIPIRYSNAFKVIGTIHDKPELLEGE